MIVGSILRSHFIISVLLAVSLEHSLGNIFEEDFRE